MKFIFTLALLLPVYNLYAQEFDYKRDFEAMRKESQDESSTYYYPLLLARFEKNDSTLTNKEMLALQIGYTANPLYKTSYTADDTERMINDFLAKGQYNRVLQRCNELLEKNPVNLVALREKGIAYVMLGKDSADFHKSKFSRLFKSIMWSGNGTYEKPFFALGPKDGEFIIWSLWRNNIRATESGRDKDGYFVDIVEIDHKNEPSTKIYFNINHATDLVSERASKKASKKAKG